MIRRRYTFLLILVIMIAFLIYAKPYRATFTDIVRDPNNVNYMYVSEINEAFAEQQIELLNELLPNAPYIFRIKITQSTEYLYHTGYVKGEVLQIFAGDNVQVGDPIFVASDIWCITFDNPNKTYNRRFVNHPLVNHEYLVFCSEKATAADESMEAYILFNDERCALSCIFDYADRESLAVTPVDQNTANVLYSTVQNNEFFVTSDEASELLTEFKRTLISTYPSNAEQ